MRYSWGLLVRFSVTPTTKFRAQGRGSRHPFWRPLGAVLAALLITGCGARYGPGAVGDPLPPEAISASQAESVARGYLDDREAPVWASVSGPIELVYDALLPKHVERPSFVDEPYAKAQVWGVQFKVKVDICPPRPHDCFTRDGLRTVFIDAMTGEWLRTSTFAPNEGVPLPTPRGLTSWVGFWL
jgi:hypothetical protein